MLLRHETSRAVVCCTIKCEIDEASWSDRPPPEAPATPIRGRRRPSTRVRLHRKPNRTPVKLREGVGNG